MNFQKMTKKQLEAHGRTIGVELDRRKTKKTLIAELTKATSKVTKSKKKAPAKKSVAKKAPAKKINAVPVNPSLSKEKITPKLSFWTKLKNFFNLQ